MPRYAPEPSLFTGLFLYTFHAWAVGSQVVPTVYCTRFGDRYARQMPPSGRKIGRKAERGRLAWAAARRRSGSSAFHDVIAHPGRERLAVQFPGGQLENDTLLFVDIGGDL